MSYIDALHTKWPLWSDGDWCHEACAEVDRLRTDLAAARAEAERAALEAENRGLRSGFVAIGQKHKADSIEYIWWCGGYPKEGALVYVTRDALTEEQLATLAPKEGNAP